LENCHLDEGLLVLLIAGVILLIIILAAARSRHSSSKKPKVKHFKQLNYEVSTSKKEKWECENCGYENDEDDAVCAGCGVFREAQYNGDYGGAGANDFGGDPLWDDDQGLI
jgi:hypothetical protein